MNEGPPEFKLDPEDEVKPDASENKEPGVLTDEQKAEVAEKISEQEEALKANLAEYDEVSDIVEAKLDDPTTPDSMREQITERYEKVKLQYPQPRYWLILGAVTELGLYGKFSAQGENLIEMLQKHGESALIIAAATTALWAIQHGIEKYSRKNELKS